VFKKGAAEQAVERARGSEIACVFALRSGYAGLVSAPRGRLPQALALLDQRCAPAEPNASGAQALQLSDDDLVAVVSDERGLLRAERRLWEDCRKSADGLISTYLGRHVSLAISRKLASRPLSPNQITVANTLLGLIAAFSAAFGGYWPVLLGAFLFQLNSILDGVDGELARMRFEASFLGEWLDTIGDDLCNLLFFAALGYGAWRQTASDLWLWMAALFAAPMIAVSLIYYARLIRMGRGDILATPLFQDNRPGNREKRSLVDRMTAVGTKIFRKDLITFVALCAAVLGVAHYVLVILLVGAWIVLAAQLREILAKPAEIPSH
jgi:phosphatidylglycerophosphate synthase